MVLSEIIEKIYPIYSKKLIKLGGKIDLDLKNPSASVKNPVAVEKSLVNYLSFSVRHQKNQKILLKSDEKSLILQDFSTLLDKNEKKPFENEIASVKSRVGFGTTLKIALK